MNWDWISQMTTTSALLTGASSLLSAGLGYAVATHRQRVRTLRYWVSHNQVALAVNDKFHGAIEVKWKGVDVSNLYVSKVSVLNDCHKDIENFKIRLVSNTSQLLTVESHLSGSTFSPQISAEFAAQIYVPEGQTPTVEQVDHYFSMREFNVPVFNRGKHLEFTLLTTVKPGHTQPAVYADTHVPGIELTEKVFEPETFGVPTRIVLRLNIAISLAVILLISLCKPETAYVAVPALILGLSVSVISACLVNLYRSLLKTFVG